MFKGNRFTAATQPQRKIGGSIEAAHGDSVVGRGHIGGGVGVGGGNISSLSGVSAAGASQAMLNAAAGPAPDERRVARHRPKVAAAGSGPTDYPAAWLGLAIGGNIGGEF